GGSLAHVILEEPDAHQCNTKVIADQEMPLERFAFQPFPISAHTPQGLVKQAQHWLEWLETNPDIAINDLAYTQAISRSHLRYRQYFLVQDKREIKNKLEQFIQITAPES